MKYIKKYNEDIEWEFDEEETPGPALDIYNLENYKIYELYEMFDSIDSLIEWLNENLKGNNYKVIDKYNKIPFRGKIISFIKSNNDYYIRNCIKNIKSFWGMHMSNEEDRRSYTIMDLKTMVQDEGEKKLSIFIEDKIKIL